ncbi:MAG: NAD-binding protein, partial [Planctomycetota bacterium]|nr:NAD-binding protein [Planctomycetota bacterium]
LQAGPAWSRAMDDKGQKMIAGRFEPQARLSQHLKDVRLILEAGRNLGVGLPLSGVHEALLGEVEAAGYGDDDNSAVIRAWGVHGDEASTESGQPG